MSYRELLLQKPANVILRVLRCHTKSWKYVQNTRAVSCSKFTSLERKELPVYKHTFHFDLMNITLQKRIFGKVTCYSHVTGGKRKSKVFLYLMYKTKPSQFHGRFYYYYYYWRYCLWFFRFLFLVYNVSSGMNPTPRINMVGSSLYCLIWLDGKYLPEDMGSS